MKNFKTIYMYEMKKLLCRKIVYVTAAVMLLALVFSVCGGVLGNYYVDGEAVDSHYNMQKTDAAYARALNGRKIDRQLLEETQAAYGKMPEGVERYTLTEEYQKYARPYSAIHNFIAQSLTIPYEEVNTWKADEAELYADREKEMEKVWEELRLTEAEKEYWRKAGRQPKTPYSFYYADGWETLGSCGYTFALMMLLMAGICLSGVFTEEHSRRTDQLLLCSRHGKRELYWAKILAGITFAGGGTLFYTAVMMLTGFLIYGADGGRALIQFMYPRSPQSVNMMEMALILYGVILTAVVMTGVFVMVLSELLHSSMGTLSIVVGMILLTMFVNIPADLRTLEQLWDFIPSNFTDVGTIFSSQLISVGTLHLLPRIVAPVLYLLLTVLFAAAGKKIYEKYQVSGR